jgi:hypothetical protein
MADETPSLLKRIDNAVRGVANGLTFGLADNLAAKADATLGSGSYAENLKTERQTDAAAGPEYTAGLVVGAALPSARLMEAGMLWKQGVEVVVSQKKAVADFDVLWAKEFGGNVSTALGKSIEQKEHLSAVEQGTKALIDRTILGTGAAVTGGSVAVNMHDVSGVRPLATPQDTAGTEHEANRR